MNAFYLETRVIFWTAPDLFPLLIVVMQEYAILDGQ